MPNAAVSASSANRSSGAIPSATAVLRRREARLIVTTTPSVEGRRVTRYCGLVTGEAILGANAFKDFFAGITDLLGGRSA